MEEKQQGYERLQAVIDRSGLSIHAFSIKIGMERAENLYRILRNKDNVSMKIWTLVLQTYPEINRDWILYGDGEMIIVKEPEDMGIRIPYYDFIGKKPLYNLSVPSYMDADIALNHSDRAMEPIIPSSATIILKKYSPELILYGQIYYIETDNFSFVRIIRKSNVSDDEIILETTEESHYDKITLTKDQIKDIYLVRGFLYKF